MPGDGRLQFDVRWVNIENENDVISAVMVFAKDSMSDYPQVVLTQPVTQISGSMLMINYEGELTNYNEPKIVFSSTAELDFSRELVGQSGFNPEQTIGNFNIFGAGAYTALSEFNIINVDTLKKYKLTSMKPADTDNDGLENSADLDDDNDGIADLTD